MQATPCPSPSLGTTASRAAQPARFVSWLPQHRRQNQQQQQHTVPASPPARCCCGASIHMAAAAAPAAARSADGPAVSDARNVQVFGPLLLDVAAGEGAGAQRLLQVAMRIIMVRAGRQAGVVASARAASRRYIILRCAHGAPHMLVPLLMPPTILLVAIDRL